MRVTTRNIQEFKKKGQKFAVLTAYDYQMAKLVEEAGVPVILVGDSLGQVVLGYDSTVKVTMEAPHQSRGTGNATCDDRKRHALSLL